MVYSEIPTIDNLFDNLDKLKDKILSLSILNDKRTYRKMKSRPLITVGSGGSFSVASFISMLHRHSTGWLSEAATPLMLMTEMVPHDSNVLFISASGRNSDIRSAFKRTFRESSNETAVFCTKENTPLSKDAEKSLSALKFEYEIGIGNEGFLAFESLFASTLLLLLLYDYDIDLPNVRHLMPQFDTSSDSAMSFENICESISKSETMLSLYSGWGKHAVLDLESKCSEAALIPVLHSDFRNFAHGRHFWLAKKRATTWLLALSCKSDEALADRTIQKLPDDTNWIRLHSNETGPLAGLSLILGAFALARKISDLLGINLKRPGVPKFGRQLYHMGFKEPKYIHASPLSGLTENMRIAILRKSPFLEAMPSKLQFWCSSYRKYVTELNRTPFSALILDYDGTVCSESRRYSSPDETVMNLLTRILEGNIRIGVATGRGNSLRKPLRKGIPKHLWNQVDIAHLNGAVISPLGGREPLLERSSQDIEIQAFTEILEFPQYSQWIDRLKSYPKQIAIFPKPKVRTSFLFRITQEAMQQSGLKNIILRESSTSVDVISVGVTKTALLDYFNASYNIKNEHMLCIGDKGGWPGNDYDLLSRKNSLSVDEISFDPNTCWNLSPKGSKGPSSLVYYLRRTRLLKQGLRIKLGE